MILLFASAIKYIGEKHVNSSKSDFLNEVSYRYRNSFQTYILFFCLFVCNVSMFPCFGCANKIIIKWIFSVVQKKLS